MADAVLTKASVKQAAVHKTPGKVFIWDPQTLRTATAIP
jgi:hypothetical protein